MSWTLTTTGAAIAKTGLNNEAALAKTSGAMEQWKDDAEGMISTIARADVPSLFPTMTSGAKQVLSNLASNMIGQKIANTNVDLYSSMRAFETALDVMENDISDNKKLLANDKYRTFLGID